MLNFFELNSYCQPSQRFTLSESFLVFQMLMIIFMFAVVKDDRKRQKMEKE